MDCTDMVIGQVRGRTGRVVDYYTPDLSAPIADTRLGGSDDLKAAAVEERNQWTTVRFRKALRSEFLPIGGSVLGSIHCGVADQFVFAHSCPKFDAHRLFYYSQILY